MKEDTGKLFQQGKRIMVHLPTKKGTAPFPIPEKAKRFRDSDFEEGMEVLVKRDDANRIVEVTIPGREVVKAVVTQPMTQKGPRGRGSRPPRAETAQPRALKTIDKASPKIIGGSFTNPYTFLPFEEKPIGESAEPTLLSEDEWDDPAKRLTGVVQLKVTTKSPLMTCAPSPIEKRENGHKVLQALTIREDVIVPATGVRGALRTLMTILTSGTLGYVDPTAFLIQGRDTKLGPATPNQAGGDIPRRVFLARVVRPGNANRAGEIELGQTDLVKLSDLQRILNHRQLDRSGSAKPVWIGLDNEDKPNGKVADKESPDTPWRLRLSGRPIGGRRMEERKREGIFKPNGKEIDLPASLWADYLGRNAAGEHAELRKDDLVWLQPTETWMNSGKSPIESSEDIESLQWARWGKTGEKLTRRVRDVFHPDSWKDDGRVDEVTNLFGQVKEHGSQAISFAGRVRPDNLVFQDAKSRCQRTVLAPMSMPHPGCIAFYRDNRDPDEIGERDWLRGYKVYRTSEETGDAGPWNYDVQGVFDGGKLKPAEQPVNQTVELLPPEQTGVLNIAYRGLTHRELALLIQACEVPWRLGGGKPLGLGACTVQVESVVDEMGTGHSPDVLLGENWKDRLVGNIQHRVAMWEASQQPVPMMRYPRAVKQNARGGHAWFSLHAKPRMVTSRDGSRENGLSPVHVTEPLSDQAVAAGERIDAVEPMISGQVLPMFDPEQWQDDLLYGYDLVPLMEHGRQNVVQEFQPLADDLSNMGDYDRHKNRSPNAGTRKERKDDRRN